MPCQIKSPLASCKMVESTVSMDAAPSAIKCGASRSAASKLA
nr:hypothetical protein [Iodobacter ciconiae]